jgi:3-hydroxyisobutyrate dehydrogenase
MPTSVSATKLSQAFHGSNDEASHRGIHGTARRTGNCAKATLPDQLSPAGINGDIEMAAARAETAEKLGYVGLGMMGSPMARRLVGAGHDLTIWNRSPEKATGLIEAGAKLVAHPSDVADAASIIFMCVTDAAAVEEVVFGPHGVAMAAGAGKLVVDFSSIHPDAARAIAARLRMTNGMGWIDAPVSGGTMGAEEGTLAVMAGGDAAEIERVRPYVLSMARRLTHMGPIGAGQTAKLCNQVIVGCAMAVLAEATRLAVNAGIDAGRLPEALAGGFADSIPLQLFVPRMVQGIHSPPLGHIATMLKDLDTVVDVASHTSSPVPMASLAAQLFRLAKAARGADADALEIFKLSANQPG